MLEFTFAPSFLTTIAIILLRGLSGYSVFKVSAGSLSLPGRTNYENAPGLPTFKMTFCESGENHQVGTDFLVRSNRCRIPAVECLNTGAV
jgi:hypothetical protein